MISIASAELEVELARSWMIGDTTTDVMTAANAGIRSILVETGHAGLDEMHDVYPDYTVPDLLAAAKFITVGHPRLVRALRTYPKRSCQIKNSVV